MRSKGIVGQEDQQWLRGTDQPKDSQLNFS